MCGIQIPGYNRDTFHQLYLAAYAVAVPGAFAWILFGYVARSWESPAARAAYSALERPGFDLIVVVVLLGFFLNIESKWLHFLVNFFTKYRKWGCFDHTTFRRVFAKTSIPFTIYLCKCFNHKIPKDSLLFLFYSQLYTFSKTLTSYFSLIGGS